MFSIVIPLYNKEKTIVRTLKSVLAQTVEDFEVIIIDDGSTDNSLDKIDSVKDNRIRVITQKNAGVSTARNKGIKESKYELITFIDADDEWDVNFLETISSLIDCYPKAKVYGTNYRLRDCHGNVYQTIINGLNFGGKDSGLVDNYFEIAAKSSPPICSICVAMRRQDLIDVGGFPIGIKSGEDLLTWAKLLVNGNLAYCVSAHSTYNLDEGYEYGSQPVRRQDPDDPVGKELVRLYYENPYAKGLKEYISHWHKMRASVAIRFGERLETLRECMISLRFNPTNFKIFPFILLAVMPSSLRNRIIRMKKH